MTGRRGGRGVQDHANRRQYLFLELPRFRALVHRRTNHRVLILLDHRAIADEASTTKKKIIKYLLPDVALGHTDARSRRDLRWHRAIWEEESGREEKR